MRISEVLGALLRWSTTIEKLWAVVNNTKRVVHIVDDDEPILDSTRLLLETLGMKVQTFSSPANYLASGVAGDADCMLFDLHMPGITGIELLDSLRSRGVDTPAILMTANGINMASRLKKKTSYSVLYKPFNEDELLSKISEACLRRHDTAR